MLSEKIDSIAGRFSFAWPEIFGKARQKDLWVEPIETSRTIQEFHVDLLSTPAKR